LVTPENQDVFDTIHTNYSWQWLLFFFGNCSSMVRALAASV